ncbi:hypothetical protein ACKI1K_44875, partial [Streptomyces scabiei]|uniref:hypothetical protein n=1 Tax=Streptomyces scabiei TaxID=1930 RepID=UPI0038F805F9
MTQMELELQAEVDKYVSCLLATEAAPAQSEALRHRLFGEALYDSDLDHDERSRYAAANDNANRYAAYLEETYVSSRRIPE